MTGGLVTELGLALREARFGFAAAAVFSVFMNLLMLVSPLYMMQVFDRVLSSGRTETLLLLSLIAGLAIAALAALEVVRARLLGRIGSWLARRVAPGLLGASLRGSLRGLSPGAQPLRDLDQVRGFVGGQGIQPLFDAPWTPLFLLAIALLHPWLGLLALMSSGVLFALAVLNDLLTRQPLKAANQAMVQAYGQVEAALRNAEVVQAMGMAPALLERFRGQSAGMLAGQDRAGARGALIAGASRFVRLGVQIGILGLGAFLVLRHELSAGGMIAGSILLGRALAPVEQAIGAWRTLLLARAGYQRLQQLLRAAPPPAPGLRLPAPQGRLSVERLSYVPPGAAKPVLKGVSFALQPGEVLGLVGPTAAGKSTLCRLLVGALAPSEGHVRLDAAEVSAWERVDFGRHVGYLPQDVELFQGSVQENIARLGPAPAEAIVAAAKLAGVHEMILHLPQGYQTEIGAYGQVLSGGQRQRIGLARALLGEPKLLVLDEPNASLDQQGEEALVAAIERVKQNGTTVVMVAHRPNVLRCVDKLLLLRNGAVELFGDRDEIMAQITGQARAEARKSERRRELAHAAR